MKRARDDTCRYLELERQIDWSAWSLGRPRTLSFPIRPYDPPLGRFLEVDPVEMGSCNDFEYVCGDPVNGMDLSGENMTADEFLARIGSVGSFLPADWMTQVYNHAVQAAYYIVITVNHHPGTNMKTGTSYVIEMARQIAAKTSPPRGSRCALGVNPNGSCRGSGVTGRAGDAMRGGATTARDGCGAGVLGASPLVSRAATPPTAAAAAAGMAAACVGGALFDLGWHAIF